MATRGIVGKMPFREAQEALVKNIILSRENAQDHHKSGTDLLSSVGLS